MVVPSGIYIHLKERQKKNFAHKKNVEGKTTGNVSFPERKQRINHKFIMEITVRCT